MCPSTPKANGPMRATVAPSAAPPPNKKLPQQTLHKKKGSKTMKIYPVILAAGAAPRLWPLSRSVLPKQLLPLVSDKTMLQETALRVAGWPGMQAPLVVCGNEHRFLVAEQMRAIHQQPLGILLESVGRNTAPAVAAAAHFLASID